MKLHQLKGGSGPGRLCLGSFLKHCLANHCCLQRSIVIPWCGIFHSKSRTDGLKSWTMYFSQCTGIRYSHKQWLWFGKRWITLTWKEKQGGINFFNKQVFLRQLWNRTRETSSGSLENNEAIPQKKKSLSGSQMEPYTLKRQTKKAKDKSIPGMTAQLLWTVEPRKELFWLQVCVFWTTVGAKCITASDKSWHSVVSVLSVWADLRIWWTDENGEVRREEYRNSI